MFRKELFVLRQVEKAKIMSTQSLNGPQHHFKRMVAVPAAVVPTRSPSGQPQVSQVGMVYGVDIWLEFCHSLLNFNYGVCISCNEAWVDLMCILFPPLPHYKTMCANFSSLLLKVLFSFFIKLKRNKKPSTVQPLNYFY